MSKKDFLAVLVIGAAVGLLVQPIVTNLVQTPSMALRFGIFFGVTVFAPLALFIASLIGKIVPVLYQFAKFSAVGTLNSFVDLGVLNLEILLGGKASGLAYTIFKAISFLAATTNSFFWNKFWTFEASNPANARETLKFYTIAIIGGVLNVTAASVVVNVISHPASLSSNLWANIGALAGIFTALLWDFLGYKYLVFRTAGEAPRA